MKICLAQTRSKSGNVPSNIENHLNFVEHAIELNADLIVFPELSISNYEPKLANDLAVDIQDSKFNSFQELSDKNQITIGVGIPTKSINGIKISMLIFQPNKNRIAYSKRILHPDELAYFIEGDNQLHLNIKGHNIALGICYETLQREHFVEAKNNNADLYIASVAKARKGTDKAYLHFSEVAKEFKIPILMSNSLGASDDFAANGLSSVWNKKGKLLGQLDEEHQGFLLYETETERVRTYPSPN